nr:hypothetical protein HK105_004758 [Polyrhizophydium stewartii]
MCNAMCTFSATILPQWIRNPTVMTSLICIGVAAAIVFAAWVATNHHDKKQQYKRTRRHTTILDPESDRDDMYPSDDEYGSKSRRKGKDKAKYFTGDRSTAGRSTASRPGSYVGADATLDRTTLRSSYLSYNTNRMSTLSSSQHTLSTGTSVFGDDDGLFEPDDEQQAEISVDVDQGHETA